jgi:hypothetical protein
MDGFGFSIPFYFSSDKHRNQSKDSNTVLLASAPGGFGLT